MNLKNIPNHQNLNPRVTSSVQNQITSKNYDANVVKIGWIVSEI